MSISPIYSLPWHSPALLSPTVTALWPRDLGGCLQPPSAWHSSAGTGHTDAKRGRGSPGLAWPRCGTAPGLPGPAQPVRDGHGAAGRSRHAARLAGTRRPASPAVGATGWAGQSVPVPRPHPRPTQWLEGTGSTKALLFLPHDAGGGESSRGSFQENKGTIYYFRVDIFVVVPAGGREHVQCRGFTRNDFEETQPYKGTRPRAPTLGGTQPRQPCAHSGSPQWGRCRGRRGVAG